MMEKLPNKYQVAKSYQQFINKTKQNKHPIQSLPACTFSDLDTSKSFQDKNTYNIFQKNTENRLRKLDLENQKPYQFVGMKEMKDFIIKMDKKRKVNYHTSAKLSFISGVQSNISSSKLQQKIKFLTKQQLIQNINFEGSKKNYQLQQTYLCDQNSIINNYTYNMIHTTQLSTPPYKQYNRIFHKNAKSQQFSLKKIKSNLQKYSKFWNKQIKNRQKGLKQSKSSRQYSKVQSSLLQNSRNFRQLKQNQQRLNFLQHKKNIQPREWDSNLRKSGGIKIGVKEIEHILTKGWNLNGQSKLKKQVNWIQKKDKQGFFFKEQKGQKFNKKSDK